jgi:hypothetical protein
MELVLVGVITVILVAVGIGTLWGRRDITKKLPLEKKRRREVPVTRRDFVCAEGIEEVVDLDWYEEEPPEDYCEAHLEEASFNTSEAPQEASFSELAMATTSKVSSCSESVYEPATACSDYSSSSGGSYSSSSSYDSGGCSGGCDCGGD